MKMNVKEFDVIARKVFAPVYGAYARQALDATGITDGACLDVGTGGGQLGIALAGLTGFDIRLLDQSPEMIAVADRNVAEAGFGKRIETIVADVREIPLDDCSVNLVVSRGSVFFWDDLTTAFREIYRILIPGGRTFIGGGFGSAAIKKDIDEKMAARQKEWVDTRKKRMGTGTMERFHVALSEADVPYEIRQVEAGFGIIIRRDDL